MNPRFFLLIFGFACSLSYAQSRTISGKVIDEFDLLPIPGVNIYADTVQLASTDMNGGFEIQIPSGKSELRFSFIGMESTLKKVPSDCNKLEMIMMAAVIYDYQSARKINRDRYKRFNALPEKHQTAYESGVFTSPSPCLIYSKDFDRKEEMTQYKEYKMRNEVLRAEINRDAKKLKVGDTVSVVFSRNATKEGYYLALMTCGASLDKPTNCLIEGRIKTKKKIRGSYNLTIEIDNTTNCENSYYEEKPMNKGQAFSYNMTYFNLKVLTK